MSPARPTIVSGIQPTGNLHLGNYLGAITRWVAMQQEGECFFFLADLHAITVHNDPRVLAANVRSMAAALIASGVDPDRATLFPQSRVSAHPELGWLLGGTARMGWLNRMTQFKTKAGDHPDSVDAGLYCYPVLMACDILLYQTHYVPVGDDQRQHIELTRDLAQRFLRIRRIHLIRLLVAAQQPARSHRIAERAVEGAGVFGGIAHDLNVRVPAGFKRGADQPDAAIHHVRRRDDIRPRRGLHQCLFD